MKSETIIQSTKWSAITETIVKLASPISNIILARLLAPEVFGLVATFTLVTSFAEIFTDGGFQKHIIQNEFQDETEKYQCVNVAFWSNFALSIFFWLLIYIFREKIANIVGSPGYGTEIAVISFQIPLFSVTSIQQALYKREFRFKQLAPIRLATSLVPVVITVPLAYLLRNSWAVIIGYLIKEAINALLLTMFSPWKPSFYYNFAQLRDMLNNCLGMMLDSFMVWLTAYAGTLIASRMLDSYHLGVYRIGYTTITSYLGLVFAITSPVVFSALSRCQNDRQECNNIFINYLKYVSYIIIPLGIGIFVFHDLVISILLGDQWRDTAVIIAYTGLTYPVAMLTGQYNSIYFRAQGKPLIAVLVQSLYVIIMIVTFIITAGYSFAVFSYAAGLICLAYALISIIAMKVFFQFPYSQLLHYVRPVVLSSIIMGAVGILLLKLLGKGGVYTIIAAVISVFTYLSVLLLLPSSRKDLNSAVTMIISKPSKRENG